ncbi:MAG: hypothetical protein IJS81_06080 [Selenomonadaceae bacterium]|nr:hypothetical protein [Selenomonadaceae bacterium]MBQ7629765.1 hypothetical protein [Selenomonadaceae bacterium]
MKIIILIFPNLDPALVTNIGSLAERLEYEITGFVSFDQNETLTAIKNYPVYPMLDIYDLSWDVAIYADSDENFQSILPRLVKLQMGKAEQFKNINWLLQQFMIKKYEDFNDSAIQATLKYWRKHELSVFNQHIDPKKYTVDKVFFDDDLPYINFKTVSGTAHKMYFPKDYEFNDINGEKFVAGLLMEQQSTSPHLYIKGSHKINAGDIVIDAGVCEGNFVLRYIDLCSKIYLFEPDKQWQEPFRRTFEIFGDKVEFIPKFVSNITDGKNITIDDALPDLHGKNIFLKMDVEGAEPRALRGAKKILTNNKVKASVCTYHNADDLIKVKSIFQDYGFKTSTSAGYMVFTYDPNIWNTADFRKGIVYAAN